MFSSLRLGENLRKTLRYVSLGNPLLTQFFCDGDSFLALEFCLLALFQLLRSEVNEGDTNGGVPGATPVSSKVFHNLDYGR